MTKIFITGSSDGIGLFAAQILTEQGHQVTLHARNETRAKDAMAAVPKAQGCLIGDLSNLADMKKLAEEANKAGPFDTVVHNAALGPREEYKKTDDNLATTFAVNSLAPYVLTFLMNQPKRVLYVSSGLHTGADASLKDIAWNEKEWHAYQAYRDSKLYVVLLANAVARMWPEVQSGTLDPGYVKTKMAGPGPAGPVEAPAKAMAEFATGEKKYEGKSGLYFTSDSLSTPMAETADVELQDRFLKACADISGVQPQS